MKLTMITFFFFFIFDLASLLAADNSKVNIELLKEMFQNVTVLKKTDAIPKYYHPEFEMHANGIIQNYTAFYDSHKKMFSSKIQYKVRFDENATIESSEKIAARVFIDVSKPNSKIVTIEVILIVIYKNAKIFRVWETAYPDWTQLEFFKDYKEK